jgi:hypothetical protein
LAAALLLARFGTAETAADAVEPLAAESAWSSFGFLALREVPSPSMFFSIMWVSAASSRSPSAADASSSPRWSIPSMTPFMMRFKVEL